VLFIDAFSRFGRGIAAFQKALDELVALLVVESA